MLAMAQWTLCDVANCVIMPLAMLRPVWIHWRLHKENGETQFRFEFHVHNLFIAPSPTAVNTVVDKGPLTDLCAPLEIHFRIAYSCARWREILQGLFLKTSTPLSLIKAFWINLILTGFILLDSTLKPPNEKFKTNLFYLLVLQIQNLLRYICTVQQLSILWTSCEDWIRAYV